MSRTANFAGTLKTALGGANPDFAFELGHPPKNSKTRECVDVIGQRDDLVVLIEVELRRTGPVTNVVKIWKWVAKDNLYPGKRVLVIQVFSKYYQDKRSFQRENASFIGDEMQLAISRVNYEAMDVIYNPSKKLSTSSVTQGGGAMRRAAKDLAKSITTLLAVKYPKAKVAVSTR